MCLGHQNLGRYFGSALTLDAEAEEGMRALSFIKDDPLFEGIRVNDEVMKHRAKPLCQAPKIRTTLSETTCRLAAGWMSVAA